MINGDGDAGGGAGDELRCYFRESVVNIDAQAYVQNAAAPRLLGLTQSGDFAAPRVPRENPVVIICFTNWQSSVIIFAYCSL